MKKKFLAATLVLCIVCLLIFSVACEKKDKAIPVESIELEETDLTLTNGEEYTLKFTVTPANGSIEFVTSKDLFDYTVVSDGEVKIKTHGSGTGKFSIVAKSDSSIKAECNISVALPQGYSQYKNTNSGVKFVYPSTWTKISAAGTTVAYQSADALRNMSLIVQEKTNVFSTANSDFYKNIIVNMYNTLGYTVVFTKCEMSKYNNNSAIRVIMDYTLVTSYVSVSFHQEQYIKNSGSKTCALTLTFSYDDVDEDLIDTVLNEFVTW